MEVMSVRTIGDSLAVEEGVRQITAEEGAVAAQMRYVAVRDKIGDTWVFNPGQQRGPVPVRIEVDLDAVVANARLVRALTATDLFAVVKADGYGHGAVSVAQALSRARAAAGFAVSLVEEGVAGRCSPRPRPPGSLGMVSSSLAPC
jgi:hypothetical protein